MASAAFLLAPQNSSVNPGSTETNNDDMVELLTASELPFAESVDMVAEPWPALNPEREDWEMVVTPVTVEVTMNPVVTFDVSVLESTATTTSTSVNPKTLMHAQSSPDLRAWKKDDDDGSEEETSSEVFVEEDPSSASSDMDMVSGPPSVWSINSSHHKLSFKEVVLQQKTQPATMVKPNDRHSLSARNSTSKPSKKTTFVVVPPHSQKVVAGLKRNSKSMGNLRALDHIQEEILGETDAELFYSQKALGAKGRESGLRIRPDEAKRLEITMNKKHQQRQQQQRQTVVK